MTRPPYTPPDQPPDERDRQEHLDRLRVLDTPAEARFDRIVELAGTLLDVPTSLVSLVDRDRQWFKAVRGLDASQTAREVSFCGHAILGADLFVVEDATQDPRFADNPLVLEAPAFRFYAGAPLVDDEGQALGTLCVISPEPRALSAHERRMLRDLGRIAARELQRDPRTPAQLAFIDAHGDHLSSLVDPATRAWTAHAGTAILQAELTDARAAGRRVGLVLIDPIVEMPEAALPELASRVRAELPDHAFLARWSSRGLLLGLPGATMEELRAAAARCLAALTEAPMVLDDGSTLMVRAHAGAATTALLPDCDADWLIQAAEDALMSAVAEGAQDVVLAAA